MLKKAKGFVFNSWMPDNVLDYAWILIVPRRNEVAEGGYWITLRPSVRPSVPLELSTTIEYPLSF